MSRNTLKQWKDRIKQTRAVAKPKKKGPPGPIPLRDWIALVPEGNRIVRHYVSAVTKSEARAILKAALSYKFRRLPAGCELIEAAYPTSLKGAA